jgi:hypothetical protein
MTNLAGVSTQKVSGGIFRNRVHPDKQVSLGVILMVTHVEI